jgi:hypothetical protein
MTAHKPVPISPAALHRIRGAAWAWPADLTLSDLGRELVKVINIHNFLDSSNREARAQRARFEAIHKHATALSKALAADEESGGMFTEHWRTLWPEDIPAASKIAIKMRELVEQFGWLEASARDIAAEARAQYGASDISAFEWLAGKGLLGVYEQLFDDPPKVYRRGRYSDFVFQVLTEFKITNAGKPYSRETLVRQLTRIRSGRGPRPRSGRKPLKK